MKKLILLALIYPLSATATTHPVIQSESKAQSKLYDAELIDVHTKIDGECYKFDGFSIFDHEKTKLLHGHICGDKITFD